MMITGGHGVRMQYDYTGDVPGVAGTVSAASPRWLRLTRSGDTLTGYDSADGAHWTKVAAVTLAGLPSTVQGGLFATSPQYLQTSLGRTRREHGEQRGDRRVRPRHPALRRAGLAARGPAPPSAPRAARRPARPEASPRPPAGSP